MIGKPPTWHFCQLCGHWASSGVPLNMLSKWMGHATLEVTAIYANALGAEEQGIAARMWD